MKRKYMFGLFAAAAILFTALAVLPIFPGNALYALSFPFEQIGFGLRVLSLSGTAGNILAIILYTAFCLLPSGFAALIYIKKRAYFEELLLPALSLLLFFYVYYYINLGLLNLPSAALPIMKAVFGGTIYSVLVAYFILKLLRLFKSSGADKLYKYLSALLTAANILLLYFIFGSGINSLISSFTTGTAAADSPALSQTAAVFKFVTDMVPHALTIFIMISCINLLNEMSADKYSQSTIIAADKLSKASRLALIAIAVLCALSNIIQLVFFILWRGSINCEVNIPLFSIIVVLAALIFSKLIAENKELKEDVESFI